MNDVITNATTLALAIVALLAPFITLLVNKLADGDAEKKSLIALAVSIILAVVALTITGAWSMDGGDIAIAIFAVVGVSQAIYAVLLRPVKERTGGTEPPEVATPTSDVPPEIEAPKGPVL